MAYDVSAEEQRQIDAAIALSLGQHADLTSANAANTADKKQARQVIELDDDSSDNAEMPSKQAEKERTARNSRSINYTKNDEVASVDSSATEESDEEEAPVKSVITTNNKRKLDFELEHEASGSKRTKSDLSTSSTTASTLCSRLKWSEPILI